MFSREPENLLDSAEGTTIGEKMNGAGFLFQDSIMAKIGEVIEGNFFILPSSTHEVLIISESAEIDVKKLSAMVYQINRTEVFPENRLSDQVQHFDTDTRVMENAEKSESRLEMEKSETKTAKKSIHECLGEKKQQKAEKKAEKAAKKNKGQEL